MKAFAFDHSLPIEHENSLIEIEQATPSAKGHDLLVKVDAISINPVDAKLRQRLRPEKGEPKVLGYDASGIVKQVGLNVSRFAVGDEVYYAGDITRPGTNSEFHIVDERITGKKPSSLSMAEAAGIPLTSITAWELLFDSLGVTANDNESILIIGGAGGVGSILIQLAKQLSESRGNGLAGVVAKIKQIANI